MDTQRVCHYRSTFRSGGYPRFARWLRALGRIAKAQAPFVDYQNSGPREITSALWKKAGIVPSGDWLLMDDSDTSEEVIESARRKQAYLVLGRVPAVPGDMEILVQGDPEMNRPFVVIEAHPARFPESNVNGARRLADFLLKPETQNFLLTFATNGAPGLPMFRPVKQMSKSPTPLIKPR